MKNKMIIASKLFETDDPSILHMLHPRGESINSLFQANPSLSHVILTDCLCELFEDDLKEIEAEKKVWTRFAGVFWVPRDLQLSGTASTWEQILVFLKAKALQH